MNKKSKSCQVKKLPKKKKKLNSLEILRFLQKH